MDLQKFDICLIIPFRYDKNFYENLEEMDALLQHFNPKTANDFAIKETIKEEFSWMFLSSSAEKIIKHFELKQKHRHKIGLHNKETDRYRFQRPELRKIIFHISKIFVWFLNDGTAYITIRVDTKDVSTNQVLDMISRLSHIKEDNKIQYIDSKRSSESESLLLLKNLVKELIGLLNPLKSEADSDTYSTALSLSYGVAEDMDPDVMKIFLENLRLRQRSSQQLDASIEDQYLFSPRHHLYWAVSEESLSLISCLKQTDENSREFLLNNLGPSVFFNYLIIYLYCYSLQKQRVMLYTQYQKARSHMDTFPSENSVLVLKLEESVRAITEISKHRHINELFYRYLCQNAWNIFGYLDSMLSKDDIVLSSEYEIFISYRRKYGGYVAQLIYKELRFNRKNAYLDRYSMKPGPFPDQLKKAIDESCYVIIILTPGCLDNYSEYKEGKIEAKDWMFEEITYALKKKPLDKIIPVLVDEFQFPNDLPDDLASLGKHHATTMDIEHIDSDLCSLIKQLNPSKK